MVVAQPQPIGVVMNGITGRIGRRHLAAIQAIRTQGGVLLSTGERLMPQAVLVGRNAAKLAAVVGEFGFVEQSTDLASALQLPRNQIYFDATTPSDRPEAIRQALQAGKHVYAEKPLTLSAASALELAQLADSKRLKHGLVQNLLFQPGPLQLERLLNSGFFGRILSVEIDFGYWVFEGDWQAAQRPSWNYRAEDGGGITLDMFPHWNGLLERLFGPVLAVSHLTKTHIPTRYDEKQQPYNSTADDASYTLLELGGGVVVQIRASWATRLYRDDFLSIQVDGSHGSAVVGYHECKTQHRVNTPLSTAAFAANPPQQDWQTLPELATPDPFQAQWEQFLRAVVEDRSFPWDFAAAARGQHLAQTALQSSLERRWIKLTPLAQDRIGEAHV